ncbi:MAG: trypsin-like peptidase domain-containing protein [Elusimicrobia bacterium]|nr:trypsin-like peptidase domain-containing protein [Elusimicrobiota bacterium]
MPPIQRSTKFRLLASALLMASGIIVYAAAASLPGLQEAFRSVAERVRPSCVNISAFHEEEVYHPGEFYFMDPEEFMNEFFHGVPSPKRRPRVERRQYAGTGSGVIIDREGHILTNAHVISDAKEIKVRLTVNGQKKTYQARLIGKDERIDLALIKIEGRGPFPAAKLGNSDNVQVGDWAIAVGNPFGELEQTLTVGVISALRQSLPIEGRTYLNLIQTDAAINRGNSGGPLVNIEGEVVGINTAIYSPSGVFAGIGFALPINAAKEILDDLRAGKEREWGWLGVSVADVDDVVAKRFGLTQTQGALVNEVFPGSPALKAGLLRGDVIVNFNGEKITTPHELTERVRKTKVAEQARIAFIRSGQERQAHVLIGPRPKWADLGKQHQDQAPQKTPPQEQPAMKSKETGLLWEGVALWDTQKNPKGAALARRFKIPSDLRGLIVGSIDSKSAMAGYLEVGDLVLGVNKETARTAAEFRQAAKTADLQEGIVLDILRQGNKQFVSVQTAP